MAASLYNLARMTTGTTGAGTITLGSAVSGFLSFSAAGVSDGETVTYAIQDGTASEIGRGVYTASGTTLTRSVLKSTNSNAAISLSGSAQVFITAAAEDFSVRTTAETTFGTDNCIVRSDGTGRGVQSSAVTVDDSGNVSGVVNQTMTGYADITEIAAPSAPASNVARLHALDDGGVTRLAYTDAAGVSRFAGAFKAASLTSASGTSVDFTGIPAGVRQIIVQFSGLSTSGTSVPIVQLGDSGGVETSGYLGSAVYTGTTSAGNPFTTGIALNATHSAASAYVGTVTLTLIDSATNKWVGVAVVGYENSSNYAAFGTGSKALSGELDRIRMTTVGGSDTFDAGSINLLYM